MDHYHIHIAAADRDKANAALEAAGHGPGNFAAGLVATAKADDAAADRYWCGIQPKLLDSFATALTKAGVAHVVTKGDLSKGNWDAVAKQSAAMKPRKEAPRGAEIIQKR